jgi:hypothetical protein
MRRLIPSDDHDPKAEDLPLFAKAEIPTAPSGPACRMVASHRANTEAGWLAWLQTPAGREAWSLIERKALQRAPGRVSTKALFEEVRAELKIELNNSHTVRAGDMLLRRHPHLADCIERRKRKSA